MALINCPECGAEISDAAKSCPNCGFPLQKINVTTSTKAIEPLPVVTSPPNKQISSPTLPKKKSPSLGLSLLVAVLVLIALAIIWVFIKRAEYNSTEKQRLAYQERIIGTWEKPIRVNVYSFDDAHKMDISVKLSFLFNQDDTGSISFQVLSTEDEIKESFISIAKKMIDDEANLSTSDLYKTVPGTDQLVKDVYDEFVNQMIEEGWLEFKTQYYGDIPQNKKIGFHYSVIDATHLEFEGDRTEYEIVGDVLYFIGEEWDDLFKEFKCTDDNHRYDFYFVK